MSLRFVRIKRRPVSFEHLFEVEVGEFECIMSRLRPLWTERVIGASQRPGLAFKLALEVQVLIVLLVLPCELQHFIFHGSAARNW